MKKVKLRRLLRESRLLESVVGDEEIVVTQFGKPCVRVLPRQPKSFLGAASHLGVKTPDRRADSTLRVERVVLK